MGEQVGAGVPADVADGVELAGYAWYCRCYRPVEISVDELQQASTSVGDSHRMPPSMASIIPAIVKAAERMYNRGPLMWFGNSSVSASLGKVSVCFSFDASSAVWVFWWASMSFSRSGVAVT